jgi:tetratricopeptide (TPR) repeat protein
LRYHEKPFAQKLDILYQRNLYVLAINLAQKAGLDSSQQNIILRKFGDYLYQKQDYDTAMQQYLKAIDNTEPSQVIRKVGEPLVSPLHVLTLQLVLRYPKDPQFD